MQQRKARKNDPIFRLFRTRVSSLGRTDKIGSQIHHEAFILLLQFKPATTVCKGTQSLRSVTIPCATLILGFRCPPFSFPMRHRALSLLSSSSLGTGSALPPRPFRCLFFPSQCRLLTTLLGFPLWQSKTFHKINAISLEFCLQGCFCFVSNIQNKNVEKKQS